MVDWSGGNDTGPTPRKDAIWVAVARAGQVEPAHYLRNRIAAEEWLASLIEEELAAGRRLAIGFDFPFGYPSGFASALTGQDSAFAVWNWLTDRIEDAPGANNRFDVAGQVNHRLGGSRGPFWGNALARDVDGLARTKADYANPFPDRRRAEMAAPGTFTCWQLAGAGAVGSQVLMGLPVLNRLRRAFAGRVSVWSLEALSAPVNFLEVWPSLIAPIVAAELEARGGTPIKDAVQVELLARAITYLDARELATCLAVSEPEEGWILGLGHEDALAQAAQRVGLEPPALRNDCFALPAGVDWTPVDTALAQLRRVLVPVTRIGTARIAEAAGRVLAEPVVATRSNPPHPNSAVDGYGFAGGRAEGTHRLPLVDGRAAAGARFTGRVPTGSAIRVLTGAALPDGVDTVILEEDVNQADGQIAFRGPLKQGANTRNAGEDVRAEDTLFTTGRVLTPADLALASAVGLSTLPVRDPLRVAVLSTGDELVEAGEPAVPGQIHDANRPMLLAMVDRFGHRALDLGRIADDRVALRDALDQAADHADAILTSGGASAGDEDHVSALLRDEGAIQHWRIAVKPGRPLALAMWKGVPIFGLPGNPVAAMVCALVFARPALAVLAGAEWSEPQGFDVPAAFEKRKKPGRREFLRARVRDGRAEVFASEGSGRISGLSWAEGLVELDDGERHVKPGDPVRFVPFGSFGL
ncbi:MAG: gephyrin-like molybdotransferase Glp [Pseudomonadota bacterium]